MVQQPRMSPCARDYGMLLVDPFRISNGACVPTLTVLPSHKFTATCRGLFNAGIQGVGFLFYNPWQMAWNDGVYTNGFTSPAGGGYAYSTAPVLYTSGAFNYNYLATQLGIGGVVPGVLAANSDSQFTNAQLTGTVQAPGNSFRLVAAGIRLKYVGTSLNDQGLVICYRQAGNDLVQDGSTSQNYAQDQFSSRVAVSSVKSRWAAVTFIPQVPSDDEFTPVYTEYPLYAQLNGNPPVSYNLVDSRCMIIQVEGASNGAPFIYEAYAHFEMIGQDLSLTKSHSDVVGTSQIRNDAPQKANYNIAEALGKLYKEYGPTAYNVAYTSGRAYLQSRRRRERQYERRVVEL
jgi:hypothetical protein